MPFLFKTMKIIKDKKIKSVIKSIISNDDILRLLLIRK